MTDTAPRTTNPEAPAITAIAESLASIDKSLKTIADALCSGVPWNVSIR